MNKTAPTPPAHTPVQPAVSTGQLMQGRDVLLLEHKGEHYVLRITRNGKLILTK